MRLPIIILCFLSLNAICQEEYRSPENKVYWKNKLPHPGYFQQDIHYKIKAVIDEKNDFINGKAELVYWNNSNDTLTELYFHLYQNAFQPGSYLDKLQEENDVRASYGKYESKKLGTEIEALNVNGNAADFIIDNTIMKVNLKSPLPPGNSLVVQCDFRTFFDLGSTRRRMKLFSSYGKKHFDGVHWYPRISVYDRKFGWDTQQHLGKEFYGEYGTYEVELDFPENFIVEATGELLNKGEVLPEELRNKLDLRNFAGKPWESPPSEIIPYSPEKRKVWKYRAINVHDFAFTADPSYRIGEVEWNGVKIIALAQEQHAAGWQNAAAYTAKVIEVYSKDFGMYLYPKMIVADARDGMEYPMLTLDGGRDPDYRGLLAHEVGHNWFFGMVGNNETYRAFLDEGFTQFLTGWALTKIDGDTLVRARYKSSYLENFKREDLVRERTCYNAYMQDAIRGNDTPLNVHSDDFNGALGHGGGYRNVYYKTATMLHNLQYVLGDDLFLKSMQFYFNRWKISHPYPEDFRQAIIDASGADLNWFFDQWIETTKTIDYKLGKIKKKKDGYHINVIRKGEMQMPIDLRVISKNDAVYDFHIPNNWFVKSTTANVLPKWYGWGKIQPEYTAVVNIPEGIKSVSIDHSGRLADIDLRNNQTGGHSRFSFDSRVQNSPDRFHQEWLARPDLWWNHFDGLKAGVHAESNYLNYKNILSASAWFNFGLGQTIDTAKTPVTAYNAFSYSLSYQTPLTCISKRTKIFMDSRFLDGLHMHSLGLESRSHSEMTRFYSFVKGMERPREEDLLYLIQRDLWKSNQLNLTINTGIDHRYAHRFGTGNILLNFRSAIPYSDVSYSQLTFTVINRNIWGKFDFNTRTFLQLGFGEIPLESALYAAGANPEQWMDSKFTRSAGFIPSQWTAISDVTNYWHQPGGLNLRGFSGYLLPYTNSDGIQENALYVPSGASVNMELGFDRLLPIKFRRLRNIFDYDLYLFGDAGLLNIMNMNSVFPASTKWMDALRADAGFGTCLTLKKFGPNLMIHPLTIRADFPIYLSNAPFMEIGNIAPRWMLSLSKSF
jgi:hypothetical protein